MTSFFRTLEELYVTIKFAFNKDKNVCDLSVCDIAARDGKLDCLQLAYRLGFPMSNRTVFCAVLYGKLDSLQYAIEKGCRLDFDICAVAAANGRLEILKYLKEFYPRRSYLYTYSVAYHAASGGHLECLKYAYQHFGWNEYEQTICNVTCQLGYFECLQYFLTHAKQEYFNMFDSLQHVCSGKCTLAQKAHVTFRYLFEMSTKHPNDFWQHQDTKPTAQFCSLVEAALHDDDEWWWREMLGVADVSNHSDIQQLILTKQREIQATKEACKMVLTHVLTNDVIDHILFDYI